MPQKTQRVQPCVLGYLCFCLALTAIPAAADELTVISVEPASQALTAPVDGAISIRFDRPVNRDSFLNNPRAFNAFGRWSGSVIGTYVFAEQDTVVRLVPSLPFSAGETVMVILSHDLQAVDGSFLRTTGYSYQFWTRGRKAELDFEVIETMTTRTIPNESTTPYGGIASDLNGDRFLDLTIVNEDTGDLRVFLNKADRSGLHDEFLQPTFPVNFRASPSEPADFNGDGHTDICVANIDTLTVSVLLGNGDGTYAPQQEITAGSSPRGIAVLDADGDGDTNFVNTNASGSNLSIFFNDGNGVFGPATYFDTGFNEEWGLAAADMNNDGLLDLVVGAESSQRMIVMLSNGNGTFTPAGNQSSGGFVWMVAVGDLNGDGNVDVTSANSTTNRGAILLGDGLGGLLAPVQHITDSFPLATDVGDLDGDGDLDWLTSSFGGDWRIFLNNGAGGFTFLQEINAAVAASCSLLYDSDNDGDLDLALIDELDDTISMVKNSGTAPILGDTNADCHVDLADYSAFQLCRSEAGTCALEGCEVVDFDGDCDVDVHDFGAFQRQFTGSDISLPNCEG